MRIGFVVDHPKRDLPTGIMLARALSAHGIETALIPFYDQGVDVPLLDLSAVIVNYARPINRPLVEQYRALGLSVYVLDTEGGVLAREGPNTPDVLARFIDESGYADLLSGYFFWGSVLRDAFVGESGMAQSDLHLTGCPRFDYASPRYRDLLQSEHSGYFLINTNFPAVNPRFVKAGSDDRDALRSVGLGDDYIDRMLAETRLILKGVIDAVRHLARRFPQEKFLLRPHPFERQDFYEEACAGLDNVIVDGRGGVLNVIKNAKALLHVNCGTAIEAVMLGVPPLQLEFLNQPFMSQHALLPGQASHLVASIDELDGIVADPGKATAKFPFHDRYKNCVQPFFHLNDGGAADRIAKILAGEIANGAGKAAISIDHSLRSSRPRPTSGQRLQGILANLAGSRATSNIRRRLQSRRTDKYVTRDAVASELAKLTGQVAEVRHARHPITGMPLISLIVEPQPSC